LLPAFARSLKKPSVSSARQPRLSFSHLFVVSTISSGMRSSRPLALTWVSS